MPWKANKSLPFLVFFHFVLCFIAWKFQDKHHGLSLLSDSPGSSLAQEN